MGSMSENSKDSAQQRVDQIQSFQRELQQLQAESVFELSDTQREQLGSYHQALLSQLKQRHDIDTSEQGRQLSLGMRVVSLLGALALAASVFFFFYQFWGYLHTWAQVLLLASFPVLGLVVTLLLASREAAGYFSKLAAFTCFACFVLNISMLGQIFNIAPSARALLLWGAFALLLAYACQLQLLLYAGLLCLMVFVVFELCHWRGFDWSSAFDRPEDLLLPSLAIFLLPLFWRQVATGFAAAYRVMGALGFLFTLWVMAHLGSASYLLWDRAVIEGIYELLGFAFAAAGIWLGIRQRWSDTVNVGSLFFLFFLFSKFVDWWWDWMPKYLFFFVLGLTAILALLVFKRVRRGLEVQEALQ